VRGVLAGFESAQALREAVERLAAAGVREIETYTPAPLDQDDSDSPLPLTMFIAGMLGFSGAMLLMSYADVYAYPLNVGGRPRFAWPAFVPIAFEIGVLCAMIAGFVGYFVVCRMPRLYDPIDECDRFREASRDGWFIALRSDDSQRLAMARAVLRETRSTSIEEFSA
jgi:Protein of unknown function (DUF3341)